MAAFSAGDQVNAIVADIGSYATKIGFAGSDYPRSYFRSVRLYSFFV
jgi:actin-related protein